MDRNKRRSFTLIEVLIVTSIIILMSGTSVAIFSSFREDKVLGNQVVLLRGAIDLAKNKAAAGDVSLCSNSTTARVSGYTVVVNPTTISLNPGCSSTPTPIIYSIPSGVTYTPPSFQLNFDSQNYQGEDVNIIIKNTAATKCKFVRLSNTGIVTNGDTPCP